MIPNSKAINIVPAPTPLRVGWDRSAVQAKRAGLLIPVAKPKTIAAIVYENILSAKTNKTILTNNKLTPMNKDFTRPILSDNRPVKSRTKIVIIT